MNKCVNAFRFRGSPLLIHSTVAPGQARRRRVWGHTVEDRPPTVWPSIPQTLTEPLIRIQHYSKHHILHNQLSLLLWNSETRVDIDLKPIFTGDDLRKPFMEPTTCMALCHILTRPILTSPHEESAKAQVTTPILQMRELRHRAGWWWTIFRIQALLYTLLSCI